jgi:hypothetical protein
MTVYIEKPAVNLRETLASLRNQGGYQEQQFWFENLVTNGTFDTATTGWTGTNATLSLVSGRMRVTDAGAASAAYQQINVDVGKTYRLNLDYLFPSSNVASDYEISIRAGTFSGAVIAEKKTGLVEDVETNVSLIFTPTVATVSIRLSPSSTTGDTADFDNISVFEVDANDDVVHRMPKGWKPKDVFEDGLLLREGAAHDYEVVYDGFDYYVKPAVAPGATTQTCVIGVKA